MTNMRYFFKAFGETFCAIYLQAELLPLLHAVFPNPAQPRRSAMRLNYETRIFPHAKLKTGDTSHSIQRQTFYLRQQGHLCVTVSEKEAAATIFIDARWLKNSAEAVKALLIECPVLVLLAWCRMPYVQAAAVSRYNKGILLLGASGSGKSTLAYACAQHGFKVLSEETVFIHQKDHRLELVTESRSIRLRLESKHFFKGLAFTCWEKSASAERKGLITLPQPQQRQRVGLHAVALLTAKSDPQKISAQQAYDHIRAALPFDRGGVTRRHQHTYRQLARLCQTVLPLSDSPMERVTQLKKMIRSQ